MEMPEFESALSFMTEQAKGIDEAIGQTGACTVKVRYLDADGNVIAEKSFKAK